MKLRNKKTGEIWDIGKVLTNDYPCWETLNQICDDWEDAEDIDAPSMHDHHGWARKDGNEA